MGDPPRSAMTDFYSILEIPKDICKAYKVLFTKWNPDKSPKNKNEAESKSVSADEWYEVINGKGEEEITSGDDPTTTGGSSHYQNDDDHTFFRRHASLFSRSSSRRSKTPTPSPRSSSHSSSRRCTTPLSRSMSRRGSSETEIPSLSFSRNARRRTSSETEASLLGKMSSIETEKPPSLSRDTSRRGATPIIFSQSAARRKPPPVEMKLECTLEELCQGCFKKIKITRDVITNTGMIIQEEEILKIQVKPGWKKGTKVTFEGKGDEKPGYLRADIIFVIDERNHPLFTRREGFDLEIGVEIPLVNALTGCSIPIPLLGGEKMTLSFDDIIYPGYEKVIRGQGMPDPKERGMRGDLRIKFLVEFPRELSDEQRARASKILQDCT